jgi:uncharacterized membrane protein YebE (DUF533 family)
MNFLSTLPLWVYVIAGLVLAYVGYKVWKKKKAQGYTPKIANLSASDFSTPRDNPEGGK